VGVRINHGGRYSAGALPITAVMAFCAAKVSARRALMRRQENWAGWVSLLNRGADHLS
jgi:hypothetical protein